MGQQLMLIASRLRYSLSQMLRNTVKDLTGTQKGRHGQCLDPQQSVRHQPGQNFFLERKEGKKKKRR
jgi:hypothetical protein